MSVNEYDNLLKSGQVSSGNEYDNLVNESMGAQSQVLQQNFYAAKGVQPERRAEALRLSKKTSLPVEMVERNFDTVKERFEAASNDYDGLVKNSPGLAQFLSDPNNAALAKDDIQALGKIDRQARLIVPKGSKRMDNFLSDQARAFKTGLNGLESSTAHLGVAYGLMSPSDAAEIVARANKRARELQEQMPDYAKEFQKSMSKEGEDASQAFNRFVGSYDSFKEGQVLKALKDFGAGGAMTVAETLDMIGAAVARPRGLAYTTVENAANMLPALATGTAGGLAAGPIGFAAGGFVGAVPLEVGSWVNQELERRGFDVTNPESLQSAYADPKLMTEIRGEAERKGITTAGVDAVFNAFAGRFFKASAGQRMARRAAVGAGEVAVQSVGETTSELAGQVAATKGDMTRVNFGEALQEGIVSLGHSFGEVAVGASIRASLPKPTTQAAEELVSQVQSAVETQHDLQRLSDIGQAVKESKLAGRMPEKLGELIQAATGQSELASVYYQADDFDNYFKNKGVSPAKAAEQILDDNGRAYFQAKESGSVIEIPLDKFVSKVAPTEDFDGMLAVARTQPDGMTLGEAQEFMRALPSTMQELAKEAQNPVGAQSLEVDEEAKAIAQDIESQLVASGTKPRDAKTYAQLYQSTFKSLAQRTGMSAKELYQRYGLRIQNEVPVSGEMGAVTELNQSDAWKTEGYQITHEIKPHEVFEDENNLIVTARDKDGNQVAQAKFQYGNGGKTLMSEGTTVDEAHRRKGIASAMYQYAEATANARVIPSDTQTEEARALWEQEGRPFGQRQFNQSARPTVQPDSLGFVSKLEQTITEKMGGSQDVQSLRAMLKDIKPEEMKWSGLDEFLKGKKKVTKEEVLQHLAANRLNIVEVTKGAKDSSVEDIESIKLQNGTWLAKFKDGYEATAEFQEGDTEETAKKYIVDIRNDDREGNTRYSQYTLPGGENYREVLLTLPEKFADSARFSQIQDERRALIEKVAKATSAVIADGVNFMDARKVAVERGLISADELERLKSLDEEFKTLGEALSREEHHNNYRSSHWDEKNILAHVRLNDRVDADGKRVLFVEEIQSDWHQAGRKRGYRGEIQRDDARIEANKKRMDELRLGYMNDTLSQDERAEFVNLREITNNLERVGVGAVPDAPFRKTWHEFAFKRILRMAAEGGYDRVAWTPGEVQAERFDLSKSIDSIFVTDLANSKKPHPTGGSTGYYLTATDKDGRSVIDRWVATKEELSDYIGKEAAEKILRPEYKSKKYKNYDLYELKNADLKVGGEGMKGFYDKILVDYANKFGKKYGAKVGEASLSSSLSINDFEENTFLEDEDREMGVVRQWRLTDSEGKLGEEYVDLTEYRNEDGSFSYEANFSGNARSVGGTVDEAISEIAKSAKASSNGQKVHSLDITPQLKDAAIREGFTLFQEGRGNIRFGSDRQFTINLLKNADMSTFLHETGHFYLEVLGDLAEAEGATKELRDDYAQVLSWLGVQTRADIKTEHHEKWARGFEAYLMEGKAPSSALKRMFTRFKVWLTAIYREAKNLNVELSDPIRGVMDRLIAADLEITQAEKEAGFDALFADPKAMGMSDAQAERYLRAREEAREESLRTLEMKLLKDLKRKDQAFYKEKRKGIEAEVRGELEARREYRALSVLRGETQIEGAENVKILRSSLKGLDAKLPTGVQSDDGIHVEIVAEMLGFADGRQLVGALSNLPSLKDAVKAETDRRMAEFYPDSLTDGTISQSALEAVHNDKRAEMLRMELEYLASEQMPVLKDVIRRVARRVPPDKMVRDNAVRTIAQTSVRELKPYVFQRAERRYAKLAGDALAKGDIDAAFEAKRNELYNHELYRAAVDAAEDVEKSVDKFKDILKRSDEDLSKSRDVDLVNAARAVLAHFGLGGENKTPDEYLKKISAYDPDAFETINSLVQSATGVRGRYDQIRYDDFVAMKEAVMGLWDLSKSAKEIEIDGRKMSIEQAKAELSATLGGSGGGGFRPGMKEAVSKFDRVKMGLLGFRSALRRVESWAEAMDQGRGAFTKYFVQPVIEAANVYRIDKNNAMKRYLEMVKAIEPRLTQEPIVANEIGYTFKGKQELLGAMLHTGNESNLRKLLIGRGWGQADLQGNVDKGRWTQFVSRMFREGVLTKEDMDFVQGIWDMLEEFKAPAQKVHKQLYGYYFNEVTANQVLTPFGVYRGGYMPAVADPFIAQDANIRAEKDALENNNNSFMFPTAGRGFTKSRVEAYAAPLSIDLALVPGHIDKVLRFVHIEPRVKQVSRIIFDREFRKQLDLFDPTVASDMLVPWLQRSAQQKIAIPSQGRAGQAFDAFWREIRTRTGLQVMTLNVVNTMQQVTGISLGAVKVKPKHLRNAIWSYIKSPKQTGIDVSEKSKFMATRTSAHVMEVTQTIDDLLLNPTKYEKARDFATRHGYFLQQHAQNFVDVIVWSGAYEQAVENGLNEVEAVRDADSAVRQTQGSFNAEDISRFETGTPFMRAFTMFYSYFNMQANILGTEFIKIQRQGGLRKGAGRALYVYTFGLMLPAVIAEAIVRAMSGQGFDEDDDDFYLDDAMSLFFSSQARTLTAMVPGVGPAVQSGINAFNEKWYDDRITTSPAVTMIESAVKAPHSVYQAISDNGSSKQAVRDSLSLLGILTGMPLAPLARPIGYSIDVSQGNAQPEGPVDFARGLITGRAGNR